MGGRLQQCVLSAEVVVVLTTCTCVVCCAACRRVADLFQSVQLNVNNPHFLIMQGRVTKVRWARDTAELALQSKPKQQQHKAPSGSTLLCYAATVGHQLQRHGLSRPHCCAPCECSQIMNMKPPEILSLLEEASGTKLYERKKDSAMKTLTKKQTRLEEIDEVRWCCDLLVAWRLQGATCHWLCAALA